MKKDSSLSLVILLALIGLDFLAWHQILFNAPASEPQVALLDVGQGDAAVLTLPGGVRIMTDAGPDGRVSRKVREVVAGDYIDLAIISHPQLDHFGGFIDLLDRYSFGAFIINGREADQGASGAWQELIRKIDAKNIPLVTLAAGDSIRYRDSVVNILSPDKLLIQSANLNDTALVELVETPSFRALLAADIGFTAEKVLGDAFDLKAEVLKVGHHGSKYSSSEEFLEEVRPLLAVVSVGNRNHYGHPAPEALARLRAFNIKTFRTDESGTITIKTESGKLQVFTER